jgi:hypothetical protein
VVEQFGLTHASMQSRVVDWFVEQDETIQAEILGLLRDRESSDLCERIVRAMGESAVDHGRCRIKHASVSKPRAAKIEDRRLCSAC